MAAHVSSKELRKMQLPELRKEIETKNLALAKMRLQVKMRSQKDTALYQREKNEYARMVTILGELERAAAKDPATTLQPKRKPSTVPVSAPRSPKSEVGSRSASK